MSEPTMIEPLRISFDVAYSAEQALNTWANKTSLWWPEALTSEAVPGFTVTYEPRIGGRIFEKAPSGKETEWGEITAWDPPKRLAYAFHIMTTRERATDVEIAFIPSEVRKTRVEITHTGWERLGADGRIGETRITADGLAYCRISSRRARPSAIKPRTLLG